MQPVSPDTVREQFQRTYGVAPEVIVRAPGRVNLIGEHTDYSLLPAMPLAINRHLLVVAGAGEPGVVRALSAQFPGEAMVRPPDLGTLPPEDWSRYVWGVLRVLWREAGERGANVTIDGDLPSGGGLSSSAALVTGLVAAFSRLWGLDTAPASIVARAVAAEHQAGVETGGLDQNAIVHARAGHALRLDFDPPGHRHVALPESLRLVVGFSGETADKAGAARDGYHERVVGCRLAAALLAHHAGTRAGFPPVLGAVAAHAGQVESLPETARPVDVARQVRADPAMLVGLTTGRLDPLRTLPVRAYARHVFSESARVDAMEAALDAGDSAHAGALLDASHASLRDDYGCSTPTLDALCEAMRAAGAHGARLTGAGFGGYAIALAPPEAVEAVVAAAIAATGGPAEVVLPSAGLEILP